MSISTNYDYRRYNGHNNQVSSANRPQRIHLMKQMKGQDSQIMNLSSDSTGIVPADSKPKSPLEDLVNSGVITSDQEKSIKDAFEASRMTYKTQAGNSTAAYKNPLDSLVEAGTITKDQETAIKNTFDSAKKAHRMPPPPPQQQEGSSNPLSSTLEDLVTSGTITSVQKDTIISALDTAFEANHEQDGKHSDPLDTLVTNGTITPEQEKAIQTAFEEERKTNRRQEIPRETFESAIKAYELQAGSNQDNSLSRFNTGM